MPSLNLSTSLSSSGVLNFPGITARSKTVVEALLNKDYLGHHGWSTKGGLHNHLSHHMLAAYDLGAPPEQLQAIYDAEDVQQRSIVPPESPAGSEDITLDESSWTSYVGKPEAYKALLAFFSDEINRIGVEDTVERYIFDPGANGNGTDMLDRFLSGAFHPLIQLGYGAEFGDPMTVALGLAQTAIHTTTATPMMIEPMCPPAPSHTRAVSSSSHRNPATGRSALSVLRAIYDSEILTPVMPYDPNALLSKRMRDFSSVPHADRPTELARLCSEWTVPLPAPNDPSALAKFKNDLDLRVEECIWLATLLTFGTGKPNRTPRLDFFLMHGLTSSLFLGPLLRVVRKPEYQVTLLQGWLRILGMYLIIRGRPRIDPALSMSYAEYPRPPGDLPLANVDGISGPDSPWPAIITSVLHQHDSHVVKSLRTLLLGAVQYGLTPAGGIIGAFEPDGSETHKGISKVDGTVFVRSAGVLMEVMHWVDYGEKKGHWDTSGLGWDGAWA